MRMTAILSDQFYNWSEEKYEEASKLCSSQASQGASAPIAFSRGNPSRLAYRALQAVWQARLQVCRRTRARSEVLSLGNATSRPASDGLRSAGLRRAGDRVSAAPSIGPPDSRKDLRDQPRITTPKGRAVGKQRERGGSNHCFDKSQRSRNPGSKHAPVAPGSRPLSCRGGE